MIKNNRVATAGICILLALLCILSPCFTVGVGATQSGYDYSRPASAHNVTVDSATLLEDYLSMPLTDAEREYLALHGSVELIYDSGITTSKVAVQNEDGILSITALEYTYTSSSGTAVTWVPVSVSLGELTTPLTDEGQGYTAIIEIPKDSAHQSVEVRYELAIEVSESDMSTLLNQAFVDAPMLAKELADSKAERDSLIEKYESDLISYEQYLSDLLVYESELAVYTDYLSRKKIYDDALREYNAYLLATKEYEDAKQAYEDYKIAIEEYNKAYESYKQYLQVLAEYNSKKEKYDNYIYSLEKARAQLSIIDAAKVNMTNDRQVFSAIMGSLVDFVIENKDLVTSGMIGIKPEVVDMAGDATTALREMLTTYFEKTDEVDKYSYYTMNYEALRDNFVNLLRALDSFYANKKIKSELKSQDKQVKYVILVAQLIYISEALCDGPVTSLEKTKSGGATYTDSLSGSYKISYTENGKDVTKTVKQILEDEDCIIKTDSAKPLEGGYPTAVEEPPLPDLVVEQPIAPTAPTIPAKPAEVTHPGTPPEMVAEPIPPSIVENPGKRPEEYIPPSEKKALVDAFTAGLLTEREPATSSYKFIATEIVQKRFVGDESVTVFFYPVEGGEPYTVSVDMGTRADYEGPIPTKTEDERATYLFSHWVDEDGTRVDLSRVDSDLVLYPYYAETIKNYSITFIVEGQKTTMTLPYGTVPELGYTPTKADDEYFEYIFSGWNTKPCPVTSDATYTATFDKQYILAYTGGGAHISRTEDYFIAECASSMARSFDIGRLILRATSEANRLGIILRTNSCNITISYSSLISMLECGETVITPTVIQNGVKGYKYSVSVTTVTGESRGEYKLAVSMPYKLAGHEGLTLTTADGASIPFTQGEGSISFDLLSGYTYHTSIKYGINLIGSSLAGVTISTDRATPGDIVEISVDTPQGIRLDRVYLVYPDGSEVTVSNFKFTMPSKDISVGIECSYIEYLIRFTDDKGKVLASYYLKYGETVIPPPEPVKASDSRYSYTFSGWSDTISPVTADKTYKAVFRSTRLPQKQQPEGLQVSEGILRLLIMGVVGICMFVFVVIPASVIAIIVIRDEKKRHIEKPKS